MSRKTQQRALWLYRTTRQMLKSKSVTDFVTAYGPPSFS